jgi:hypothetical protein
MVFELWHENALQPQKIIFRKKSFFTQNVKKIQDLRGAPIFQKSLVKKNF